ncbi:uncharacterized protein [Antedon mediterranea]|uniref:uncharacterized protein n=1 Tax=Antedon mediterranea TaxID=105859 RepID=UPI003AF49EB9
MTGNPNDVTWPPSILAITRKQAHDQERQEAINLAAALNVKTSPIPDALPLKPSPRSSRIVKKNDNTTTAHITDHSPLDIKTTPHQLAHQQKEDKTISTIIHDRTVSFDQINSHRVCFYLKDDILFRKWKSIKTSVNLPGLEQIVLPTIYRPTILSLAHDNPTSGHLGVNKTTQRILQSFYWPGIFSDVATYCRTCDICQKTAHANTYSKAPMKPIEIVGQPFSKVGIDILGPLKRSKNRKAYILTICDYATRFPFAVPLSNIEAKTVADALILVFKDFGFPSQILSDQGTNFTSRLMKQLSDLLQIEQMTSTPFHQQTNGLVEKFNGTMKNMIKSLTPEQFNEWDRYVPLFLFAYRDAQQESTGFTPFELVFAHEVKTPLRLLKDSMTNTIDNKQPISHYISDLQDKLRVVNDIARTNLKQAQAKQKHYYDKKTLPRKFKVGQKVLILLPDDTSKVKSKWQGPYPISKVVSDVNYEILVGNKHKTYHINLLRLYNERPQKQNNDCMYTAPDPDPDDWFPPEPPGPATSQAQSYKDIDIPGYLTPSQKDDLHHIFYSKRFMFTDIPGRTDMVKHEVRTTTDTPIRQKAYRIPYALEDPVKLQIQHMHDNGIIEPSTSPWAAPIVSVPKPDGSLRICTDYRELNKITIIDPYPMPRIDDIIDKVGNAKFITKLDLTQGYYQIALTDEAKLKSAFITPWGQYQYKVMPFGMANSPGTFQRLIDNILRGTECFARAYLDDIAIFSTDWNSHLLHITEVLDRINAAGLTVKPTKCEIAQETVSYLGHVIGNGLVRPSPDKLSALQNYPRPITKTNIRAFLGLANYYRKFIPDFSQIALPLTEATRKSSPNNVNWSEQMETSFRTLQTKLTDSPVLVSPNFDKQFILQCDASNQAIGAVLTQCDDNEHEHPVAYLSKKLTPCEENYGIMEKECLAILWAIRQFHVYLYGRPFIVQTDHKAIKWLDQMKTTNPRLTRWSLTLQPYSFTVQYKKGSHNTNADALSRI